MSGQLAKPLLKGLICLLLLVGCQPSFDAPGGHRAYVDELLKLMERTDYTLQLKEGADARWCTRIDLADGTRWHWLVWSAEEGAWESDWVYEASAWQQAGCEGW